MKHLVLTIFLILGISQVPLNVFANETSIPDVISNSEVQDMSCVFVKEINKGELFHMLKITSDSKKGEYLYLHINRETFLPYKLRYKKNGNTATYTYKNVELNKNLKKDDFKV